MSACRSRPNLLPRVLALALLSCGCATILFSCREVDPRQKRSAVKAMTVAEQGRKAAVFDTLEVFASILDLEDSIFVRPRDAVLRGRLLSYAIDTADGCILAVGKATFNPDFPEAARQREMQSAASAVAKRWALYVKAWHTGGTMPFGTPISGDITYAQLLHEERIGDTLFVMLSIPVGSVVVR